MRWDVIREYLPFYHKALILTLRIGWLGVLLAILLGLAAACFLYFRVPVLRAVTRILTV